MEASNIDKIETKNTRELYLVATQFCTFMENIHTFEPRQIIDYLLKIMPLMYLKGALIQDIQVDETVACEQFVTEEQYELLYLKLKDKLTEMEFFESYNLQENETKTYSICEILTDIYQDMKDFVLLYNKNTLTTQENALLMHKKYFIYTWGKYITILLSYLHQLAYPVVEEEEEIDE
ncbi:MAG: DUF5063 domain-containing protein [Bacteroidales bacterium]|jgi:hypothetical protein|nr:DUF5063 domain-containing protein [Bacteroidales bacterium]